MVLLIIILVLIYYHYENKNKKSKTQTLKEEIDYIELATGKKATKQERLTIIKKFRKEIIRNPKPEVEKVRKTIKDFDFAILVLVLFLFLAMIFIAFFVWKLI